LREELFVKRRPARDRILEAALKVFSRNGYLGATTREIAREAGVAELTLFRHFQTKEGLFDSVLKESSVLPALKELMPRAEELPYRDALALIARSFLDRLVERADLVRILHSEVHLYPEKVREIHRRFMQEVYDTITRYFRGLQRKGALGEFDPYLGARAFLGMFFAHFQTLKFLPPRSLGRLNQERLIKEYVDIFVHGTLRNERR
jgi:AcrR family transcriptional regulator